MDEVQESFLYYDEKIFGFTGLLHCGTALHELIMIRSEFKSEGVKLTVPSIMCKDIGMDCPFEAQGTTNNEIMRKFIDHAESAHKMQVLPADIIFKVQHAIKK